MSATYNTIRNLIPLSIRKKLLKIHHHYVLNRALSDLLLMADKNAIDRTLLKRLIYGWGNQGFSAQTDYLESCVEYAYKTNGSILECGSGLSTIIVGVIAKKRGIQLTSFEHYKEWGDKVAAVTQKLGLDNVTINVKPLKDYGDYCWYDVAAVKIPANVGLVICDGPPAQTKGGRYGMVPVVGSSLKPGAVILMDDTIREDERKIIERWKSILNFTTLEKGRDIPHAILHVG